MRNNFKPLAENQNISVDEMSAQMADMTLSLFESFGMEAPYPTPETVKTFVKLVEESYNTKIINN